MQSTLRDYELLNQIDNAFKTYNKEQLESAHEIINIIAQYISKKHFEEKQEINIKALVKTFEELDEIGIETLHHKFK
jgi:hypothetical protein